MDEFTFTGIQFFHITCLGPGMDDHKSYHDDPPTYEETMAGILPPPPDENSPPHRRSESSASETSTARPGINWLD